MKHSDEQIEETARRFEALADDPDPETAQVEDLADLAGGSDVTDTQEGAACARTR